MGQATEPDVVVVGAGLAGLVAAAVAADAGAKVEVRERSRLAGGQARTDQRSGFFFNQGPHALYRKGPAEQILTKLGIKIEGGRPATKGLIRFDGVNSIGPVGPVSLARTDAMGWGDKAELAKTLTKLPFLRPEPLAETSVADWVEGLVSKDRVRAMILGLVRLTSYGNNPSEMSAEVALSQLKAGLITGVRYLHNGWQPLVDQLVARPGVTLSHVRVEELPDAPVVIVATGSPASTGALLGRSWSTGPAANVSCLDLGLATPPPHNVVIGGDEPLYFSNHSSSASLAPAGQAAASAMHYLGPDDEPNRETLEEFARHSGVADDDIVESRYLHRMTACTALATAANGGLAGRPRVTDSGHDNVFIAGDWVGPVGHLADCSVASGFAAAMAAL